MAATTNDEPRRETLVFSDGPKFHPQRPFKMAAAFTDIVRASVHPTNGFRMQCLDRSQSCLFEWNIPPERFASYDIETPHTFGIALHFMLKILADAGGGASVEWDCTDDAVLNITITPSAAERKKGNLPSAYTLKTVNVEGDYMDFPPVSWATARVATAHLKREVATLRGLADEISHVGIWLHEGGKVLLCRAQASTIEGTKRVLVTACDDLGEDDADDADDADDDEEKRTSTPEERRAYAEASCRSYQGRLMQDVLDAASSISTHAVLHWSPNCPLLLRFDDEQCEEDGLVCGIIEVYVAPREDEEDEDE